MDVKEIETIDIADDTNMDVDNSIQESSQKTEAGARAEAKITFKTSLSNLTNEPQLSEVFYVRDLPWQIKLEPRSTRMPRTLAFYVRCNGVSQPSTWSCFVEAELRLLKQWSKPSIYSETVDDAFSRTVRHVYHNDENEAGLTAFISWEDLCDPRRGFLIDNNIEVQAYVKADVPRIQYDEEPKEKTQDDEAHPSTTYHFQLNEVSGFRGRHLSPIFEIHNMPFKFFLETVPEKEPKALSFILICLADPKCPSWSCYVEAELKLLKQNNIGESYTRALKHLFHRNDSRSGFHRFVSWKNFLDSKHGFIKNDTACFEIVVRTNASAVKDAEVDVVTPINETEAKVDFTVHNIRQLKDTVFTSLFYARNLPWRLKLMRRTCVGPTRQLTIYLSIYLQCTKESAEDWSCNVRAMLRLLKHNGQVCGRVVRHLFNKEKYYAGFSHFIPWNQLLDPNAGYIKNESISLQVILDAEEPSGIKTSN